MVPINLRASALAWIRASMRWSGSKVSHSMALIPASSSGAVATAGLWYPKFTNGASSPVPATRARPDCAGAGEVRISSTTRLVIALTLRPALSASSRHRSRFRLGRGGVNEQFGSASLCAAAGQQKDAGKEGAYFFTLADIAKEGGVDFHLVLRRKLGTTRKGREKALRARLVPRQLGWGGGAQKRANYV